MPGSPPMSVTPPETMPPPSTRSSSSSPVGVRATSVASISERVASSDTPASAAYCVPKRLLAGPLLLPATCSMSVFQAPQLGHLPSHLGLVPPHSLQTKRDFSLAMPKCREARHAQCPPARGNVIKMT